ncbi:hypothetical protein [Dyadobacter psychrotolerans]|uniref:Uncharacterized protein n=1 Tax=Dyadobacter psychrotolerans TaxID=2541721 RepID=A0A4R5E1U0_9BACT|nr:hypothetical protein [Dyadobacter psychrotolerans]TDE18075.1 hypothetical protein E0F88_00545 [Dyadobacter psychrotolerans]
MFYKFNAHRARKPAEKADYKLARQIFKKLIRIQRCWASFMQSRADKLRPGWLRAFCLTVMSVSSGYCTYLIFEGFSSLSKPEASALIRYFRPFDQHEIKEQLHAKVKMSMYLDSLESAVIQDSLNQLNQTQK